MSQDKIEKIQQQLDDLERREAEEDIAQASEKEELSTWRRFLNGVVAVCLPLIALGQWVDTRDLIIDGYQGFVTNFTDQVELDMLEEVRIGANLAYLEDVFGVARLIKASNIDDNLEYRYYFHPKFLLALAVDGERITGYSVTPMVESFQPRIAFSDVVLGEKSIADMKAQGEVFTADSNNIHFYIEEEELPREGLFFKRYLAHVEYGAPYSGEVLGPSEAQQLKVKINVLNDAYLRGDYERAISSLTEIRQLAKPNSYAIGNLDLDTATEMILTRYEFHAYFGGGS